MRSLLCVLLCFGLNWAHADTAEIAGAVEAEVDGQRLLFSALKSRYDIDVSGDVVNVRLTQTFSNPLRKPVHARYLFPLNKGAAVHAMTMRIGDEEIIAQIQERQQAKKTFAKASSEGKAASLLEQHRPNMFTQKIANLMPGLPIEVTIEYSHLVPKVDGAFELVVPLVVGPRFNPPAAPDALADRTDLPGPTDGWVLNKPVAYPQVAGVDLPASIAEERVTLNLALEVPFSLSAIHSDTHRLKVRQVSSSQADISFEKGTVLDNRDFVLRYEMGHADTDAGLLTHWQVEEGGYFSLLIEPPADPAASAVLPREMVFLLDCSGSMSGLPMQASKTFMRAALNNLRPQDTFRIIRFSDSATEFSARPLKATPGNVQRGLYYTAQLRGGGGTMMTEGIRQALALPVEPGRVRNVVFLTDGYIGNEVSVLTLVKSMLGHSRLFAFGVGAGVNRFLLDELGRVGRGFSRYFDPTEDSEALQATADQLAARLQTPVLADIQIDWGDLPVSDIYPATLPDLYAGDTLRVTGRFSKYAQGDVTVRGRTGEQSAALTRTLTLSDVSSRPAIRRVWARTAVKDRQHGYITPLALREANRSNDTLQAEITDLGLRYELVTRWTSFVAVSRKVYNTEPEAAGQADVPLAKVAGVSTLAYPSAMVGMAAPEPGALAGLLVALAVIGLALKRRRPA